MSASNGSVSYWIAELHAGNPRAAQEIWNRYFHRLVGLARVKLRGMTSRHADEEDVAVSAFRSFFRRAREGQFPELEGDKGLWPLLVKITACKAYKLQRDELREKRGGGRRLPPGSFPSHDELVAIVGAAPTVEFTDQLMDEFRHLIEALPDPECRQIVLYKMEGMTNREVAEELGLNIRRVQRRLEMTRTLWNEELSL